MKSVWANPEPVVEWLKDNVQLSDLIDAFGREDVKENIMESYSAEEAKDSFGEDLLHEFTKEELIEFLEVEHSVEIKEEEGEVNGSAATA